MLQNLPSAAVTIGVLRVNPMHSKEENTRSSRSVGPVSSQLEQSVLHFEISYPCYHDPLIVVTNSNSYATAVQSGLGLI